MNHASFTRRDVLKAGGALVVSFMMPGPVDTALGQTPTTSASRPPPTPDDPDPPAAVLPHGSVTPSLGKMVTAHRLATAHRPLGADAPHMPIDPVPVDMGDP